MLENVKCSAYGKPMNNKLPDAIGLQERQTQQPSHSSIELSNPVPKNLDMVKRSWMPKNLQIVLYCH